MDSQKAIKQQLDTLFKSLYHEESDATAIYPEGMEDVDLLGLHMGGRYIQAKIEDEPYLVYIL
ncbi:MAG TPA: hypothetical protein VN207_07800 [Ktedonobacteraceae bacterium]|nr:hypothetical protein [Ktedonobacteraceae bacterium]